MDRELDGVYFRIKRNGKWENVCFSDMTEDQMNEVMNGRDVDWLKSMCIILGQCIKTIGNQFDIYSGNCEDEGVEEL